jgi:hypothetical protein
MYVSPSVTYFSVSMNVAEGWDWRNCSSWEAPMTNPAMRPRLMSSNVPGVKPVT